MKFQHYLESKRLVDDRSLKQEFLLRFASHIPHMSDLLDIGAGTGSMLRRLATVLSLDHLVYHAIDTDPISLKVVE